MAKYSNVLRLSKEEQEGLFIKFAKVLASLKNPVEAAKLIRDLLTEQEVLMLARRLQIAELLTEGFKYSDIHKIMKVGDNTIAKVQFWLRQYGEGYRSVLKHQEHTNHSTNPTPIREIKKKYPMYFWPQIVLEEIVKSANRKELDRLRSVLKDVKEKSRLSKQLLKYLNA